MTDTITASLTGKALLQKAKELNNLPKREQAKKCGYFTRGKDGVDRVNLTEFYEAVLAARGFAINPNRVKMDVVANLRLELAFIKMVKS